MKWPWVLILVALAFVNFAVWAVWTGECVDYTAESGLQSTCTSAPSVGFVGAWTVSGLSILMAGYAVYRLARSPRA